MTTFTHCFWFLSYLSSSEIQWGKNGGKAPFNATMIDYLKREILTHLKGIFFLRNVSVEVEIIVEEMFGAQMWCIGRKE